MAVTLLLPEGAQRDAVASAHLAGPGLDDSALERCAERVTERARRLALTV